MSAMKEMDSFVMLKPTLKLSIDRLAMAPRLGTLDGKTIGLLWNGRMFGDLLLKMLVELLGQRFKLAGVIERKKLHINTKAPKDVLEELADKCDAVITALGD